MQGYQDRTAQTRYARVQADQYAAEPPAPVLWMDNFPSAPYPQQNQSQWHPQYPQQYVQAFQYQQHPLPDVRAQQLPQEQWQQVVQDRPPHYHDNPQGHGENPRKRRLVSEEKGTYELMETLGLGAKGGRKVIIEDRNVVAHVPASVNDTVEFWNWLQSMRPPLEEAQNKYQAWERLCKPATPVKLPESFLLRVRWGEQQVLAHNTQLLLPYELQGQGLRMLDHELARSGLLSVEAEELPELTLLWKHKVVENNVPTSVVTIDDLLVPSRPWVAEFRYLHFLLFESRLVSLGEVVKMRSTKLKNQNDDEAPYHPLLLCFCQGAASGQPEVNFFAKVDSESSTERICLLVNNVSQPTEVTAAFRTATREYFIDSNRSAFAKMLKSNTEDPRRWNLGFFAERIERIWFGFFEYNYNHALKSIKVAPEFPCMNGNQLFDIRQLDKVKPSSTLQDVVSDSPLPGFLLLVRYVDTLCNRMGIPVTPIRLIPDDEEDAHAPDLTEARLVDQGQKSLVLKTGDNVTKISKGSLILHEQDIHAAVDGLVYVRPLVKGQHGVVEGAGDGLRWISMRGFGRHLRQSDVSDIVNYDMLWRCAEEAVYNIHGKGVFHRDIKPGNFLIVHGMLELSDFDASCFVDDAPAVLQQLVGTPYFQSSFLMDMYTRKQYQHRDDWCSLVLTFLSLHGAYVPGTDKQAAMQGALQLDVVPEKLKDCIRWVHSTAAENGNSRQQHTL